MNERPLWLALAVCILVRIVLEVRYGLGFDVDVKLWQLVDVELLRDDPLRSLFLMHAQPPLFNALYALSLRLPEGLGVPFLHLVFQATSIVSVALIYLLLRRARVGPVGAAIAAGLFGILPQTLIFESVFNYAPFEVMFLLGGMLLAARYLEEGGVARFAGLCACLVILAFMRSLFHIGWIAVALLAVWSLRSWRHGRDSRALAVLVVSLALVSSIYFKNLKLYGAFAASTWEGIALTQLAAPILPGDPVKFPQVLSDIRQRIDRGEFSPALKGAITDLWYGWVEAAKDCPQMGEKRAVLCARVRASGEPNMNHLAVIEYSHQLGGDARRLLQLYPQVYLNHVAASVMTFLGTPSWHYRGFDNLLPRYCDFWNDVLLYHPNRGLRGLQAPGQIWGSVVNRLTGSSVPLILLVATGIVLVLWRGGPPGLRPWPLADRRLDLPHFCRAALCHHPQSHEWRGDTANPLFNRANSLHCTDRGRAGTGPPLRAVKRPIALASAPAIT